MRGCGEETDELLKEGEVVRLLRGVASRVNAEAPDRRRDALQAELAALRLPATPSACPSSLRSLRPPARRQVPRDGLGEGAAVAGVPEHGRGGR